MQNIQMRQVTVVVPATTANLGPGFDCLGMALGLYNQVIMTAVSEPALSITITGEGAGKIPTDKSNLVVQSANILFTQTGKRPNGLHLHQHNDIPAGSGLGSSASAVLAGLLAANALLDFPLSLHEILQLAAEKEGHPDNVTPALYGGLTLTVTTDDRRPTGEKGGRLSVVNGLYVERISIPLLQVVIVLPNFDLPTAQARAAIPLQIPLKDAVFNIGRVGLLIRALETGNWDRLWVAMQDKLHQPYRLPLIPGITAAFEAAIAAGARGVALSGAGPSIIAFSPENHLQIAAAITAEFAQAGLSSRSWILPVDTNGSRVMVKSDE